MNCFQPDRHSLTPILFCAIVCVPRSLHGDVYVNRGFPSRSFRRSTPLSLSSISSTLRSSILASRSHSQTNRCYSRYPSALLPLILLGFVLDRAGSYPSLSLAQAFPETTMMLCTFLFTLAISITLVGSIASVPHTPSKGDSVFSLDERATPPMCGKQSAGALCPSSIGTCCSQYGYCGNTEAYCGQGCQSGSCLYSTDNTCGSRNGGKLCSTAQGICCSQYGYCGSSGAYCEKGCQSGACERERVRFAGINIAGCDFGIDTNVRTSPLSCDRLLTCASGLLWNEQLSVICRSDTDAALR